jgi:1-acyl-sn-glycerol-3-phosphate acyltransferase
MEHSITPDEMTADDKKNEPIDLKPYKSYPVSYYSRWRIFLHLFVCYFLVTPFIFLKCRPHVSGRENLPKAGPYIVASNHVSMLDPPLIAYAMRYPVAFMAKKELFNTRLKAEFYRLVGTFALDRDNPDSATLKTALNVLKSPTKWALCIFPEGTRSENGQILPLKKGIGALAHKTGVPVVPVGITKGSGKDIFLTFGKPITDVSDPEAIQDQVYQALVNLTGNAP